MVIQKAVDNLKERPKDQRRAVAGGIAFAIMVLLFLVWAFLFVKNLQKSNVGAGLESGAGEIMKDFNASNDELQQARDEAALQSTLESGGYESGQSGSPGAPQ